MLYIKISSYAILIFIKKGEMLYIIILFGAVKLL